MTIIEYIQANLRYEPNTGDLYWKIPGKGRQLGKPAGTMARGRLRVFIIHRPYAASRIAWLLSYGKWPLGEIDHINKDTSDNRLINLRDTTRRQNSLNDGRTIRGVSWDSRRKKWRVKAHHTGNHVGYFGTYEAACEASKEYWKDKLP